MRALPLLLIFSACTQDNGPIDTDDVAVADDCPFSGERRVFDFADGALSSRDGAASVTFRNPGGDALETGRASRFALPPAPDGSDPHVIRVPALRADQTLRIEHGLPSNGFFAEQGLVSRYTIVFDVFIPDGASGTSLALWQTDPLNLDDAELFLDRTTGRVGILDGFHGETRAGAWHRVAVAARTSPNEGQIHKFIDGTFVGGQGTTGSPFGERWALQNELLLLSDDDGDTSEVFLAGLTLVGETLPMPDLAALGGVVGTNPIGCGEAGPPLPHKASRAVQVFAHRGDSCCAPENTLSAIRQAFDKGADHIEVDVRVSADGQVVLFHDATLDRTTDSAGPMGERTVAELKALDAGSWFHPDFTGERIPTLTEALQEAEGRGRLYLDIKEATPAMAAGIARALEEADASPDALWVWSPESLFPMYQAEVPGVPFLATGSPRGLTADDFARLKAAGTEGFSFGWSSLRRESAAAATAAGLFVEVFTILDPDRMIYVIDEGADAMETDFPETLASLLPDR